MRKRMERLRLEREKTEKMLKEREDGDDAEPKLEVDRLYRLKELHSYSMVSSGLYRLKELEAGGACLERGSYWEFWAIGDLEERELGLESRGGR
ncbi:hypothetical protein LINPERPRIM_LOCUS35847 [Linum perenne]